MRRTNKKTGVSCQGSTYQVLFLSAARGRSSK